MKTPSLHHATITISFLAAVSLLGELILSHQGKSLCQTSACQIVGRYILFGEPVLLAFGAGFFIILAGLIFFAGRYGKNSLVPALPVLTIIGAAAFDGALLGFQFITLRQHCQLCISVALALATIALLHSSSLRQWIIFGSACAAWVAGFMASAILIMPEVAAAHSGMIFYERAATREFPEAPTATLIFSMECPHCQEVLSALAQKNPKNISWKFAAIDNSVDAINKLGYFYEHSATSENPFQLVLDSKHSSSKPAGASGAKLLESTRQARIFLANNGITGIPFLGFQETKERGTFRVGSLEIAAFIDSLQ